MLLEKLIQHNIRPAIRFKNNRYICRYRNTEHQIDREAKFDREKDAIAWRSKMINTYGVIKNKGPAQKNIFMKRNEKVISASSQFKEYITFWLRAIRDVPKKPAASTIACLKHMLDYDIVRTPVDKLNYSILYRYMMQRAQSNTKPSGSTLNIDMSAISRVISDVNSQLGITFDDSSLIKARQLLRKNGLIKSSGEKDRRLMTGEWKRLLKELYKQKKSEQLRRDYTLVLRLYISTALRCSELLSLTWGNIDFENSTIKVVVLKQKGKHTGSVKSLPMLDKSRKLFLKLRPKNASLKDPIFHIKGKTMSTSFTKIAKGAGIDGLSLHDLRTEGICRMLELGLSVAIVASFTGHREHSTITRIYTNLCAHRVSTNLSLITQINRMQSGTL
ncbi:tyrosine-type recombinase/integrase [Alteromonas sp. OM2203]|uniref:tyrosine-type recombinase/integrase n=1 Tax=Alteromonas sp. OM2203 TaxID=3398817 RepID=UPI003AF35DF3